MFIAIDVGNTNITVGIRESGSWTNYRIGSEDVQPLAYYSQQLALIAENIDSDELEGVGISSVVPHLTDVILDATRVSLYKNPILFQKKWYNLLPIKTKNPDEMGTDLLANALAGFVKYDAPVLVVDFGTALTYTMVNTDGQLNGVAIAPGIKTAMQALAGKAAQLPEINLDLPESALGTNTSEAMSSGILWGFVGQVSYMINKIKQEFGTDITTIATGGLSEVLKPLKDQFDVIDRDLTVEGIYKFSMLVQNSRHEPHEY
jgi:type III pantothenate kinase